MKRTEKPASQARRRTRKQSTPTPPPSPTTSPSPRPAVGLDTLASAALVAVARGEAALPIEIEIDIDIAGAETLAGDIDLDDPLVPRRQDLPPPSAQTRISPLPTTPKRPTPEPLSPIADRSRPMAVAAGIVGEAIGRKDYVVGGSTEEDNELIRRRMMSQEEYERINADPFHIADWDTVPKATFELTVVGQFEKKGEAFRTKEIPQDQFDYTKWIKSITESARKEALRNKLDVRLLAVTSTLSSTSKGFSKVSLTLDGLDDWEAVILKINKWSYQGGRGLQIKLLAKFA